MIDDDARLMLRVRGGDRRAFEALFRRYTPPLVNFLARMLPERDRAEELAQEVFLRVYQARGRYEPRARFSTWLFSIASNLALNELGRSYRKRETPLEQPVLDRLEDPQPGGEERLEAKRAVSAVERALARLPDRQRAALLLRAERGLGYAEIGEVLGASPSSVKSLIHRARENLLTLLGEREP
jgi:RNA polymerase sigma-70 factor (ECF subfamily)